jgi:hypothetical protein
MEIEIEIEIEMMVATAVKNRQILMIGVMN